MQRHQKSRGHGLTTQRLSAASKLIFLIGAFHAERVKSQ
jgi:hypothetical protein